MTIFKMPRRFLLSVVLLIILVAFPKPAGAAGLCDEIAYLIDHAGPRLEKISQTKMTSDLGSMKIYRTTYDLRAGYTCSKKLAFDIASLECVKEDQAQPLKDKVGACLGTAQGWEIEMEGPGADGQQLINCVRKDFTSINVITSADGSILDLVLTKHNPAPR